MKKTVAVIFGGKSVEHDVSIITAHTPIIDSLISIGEYDVIPIYIDKNGNWYSDQAMNDVGYFRENLEEKLSKLKPIELSLNNEFAITSSGFFKKKIKIDLVFPSMHGTFGEDGSLMGILRMAGVPFVGCDMTASSIAMDKVLTKQIISADGLLTPKYVWFTKEAFENKKEEYLNQIKKLNYPLFVKPVHLGSSIGISKVNKEEDLLNAIELALHYDNKVLVEEGVNNLIEVTLPMIGNEEIIFGCIERPLNKTDFFNFEDKYMNGGKKLGGVNNAYSEIPANIDNDLSEKIKEIGRRVYKAVGCSGIARIDFLIDQKTKNVYVNEINTLPGSLYHHNWKKAGISNVDLVKKLLEFSVLRFESDKSITYSFGSEVLKNVGGSKNIK